MKSIIRKTASVSAAAVMISAFAIQSTAYTAEVTDNEEYQFNKPYLNINVDGGEFDLSEIVFSLKNSDGDVVASWKGDSDKFTEVADGLYDITDINDFTSDDWYALPWDKLDREGMESKNPYGDFYKGYAENTYHKELYTGDYVYPVDGCFYEYIDSEYLTGETMTVPANTIVLDSDEAYKTNNDNYSAFSLKTYEDESGHSKEVLKDTYFKDYAGEKSDFSVPAGKYRWFLGGWAGGVYAKSYEDTQEYVQVKLNLQDLLGSSTVNDNYEFIHKTSNGTVYCPAIGPKDTNNKVSFAFLSGSVVSAAIPDDDGNICVWINANDPMLQFEDSFAVTADGWISYGGGQGFYPRIPTVRNNIKAKFEMPTDGLTLYNIPSGDYTVEIDSTEYALENNSITVTDTKDIQRMSVVLKDAGESSSESSSEVSSSETSSSDISSSQSSSEVTSSQDSSSTSTSSVTNSSTSSNATSTSKAANNTTANTNNTPNPATGAAAGFTGVALIAGAVFVVSKKNRK